jgi:hypothetical protein
MEMGDTLGGGGSSPTLLSALKGSSLRQTFGQDFTRAFNDDNMSLLGDLKNAAARFDNAHAMEGGDGLSAEGDLQSDALWSSFPSDVDALFPSFSHQQLSGEMYTPHVTGGRGMPFGRGADAGGAAANGAGAVEARATPKNTNPDLFRNANNGNGVCNGVGVHSQSFIFGDPCWSGARDGPPNAAGHAKWNGAPHQTTSLDSSHDAYAAGNFKQLQHGGGGGGEAIETNQRASYPGMSSGQGQAGQAPSRYHGGTEAGRFYAGNGQAQNGAQGQGTNAGGYASGMAMHSFAGGIGGGNAPHARGDMGGGAAMRGEMRGGAYPGNPMMRVPSSASMGGMMGAGERGFVGDEYAARVMGSAHGKRAGGVDGGGAGVVKNNNTQQRGGGTRGAMDGQRGTRNEGNAHTTHVGGGSFQNQNGSWNAYGHGAYRAPETNQSVGYHHPHAGAGADLRSMYSGSSSVSTAISGRDAGVHRNQHGAAGNQHAPNNNNNGMMMFPPYGYANQPGPGAPAGVHDLAHNPLGEPPRNETGGLDELRAIIGKLDAATSHNIKESLFRLASSARIRGARGAGPGVGGGVANQHQAQQQRPGDKAQSMVDRCMANLLYHRYPDSPAEVAGANGECTENETSAPQMKQKTDARNGGRVGPVGMTSGMSTGDLRNIAGRQGSA